MPKRNVGAAASATPTPQTPPTPTLAYLASPQEEEWIEPVSALLVTTPTLAYLASPVVE